MSTRKNESKILTKDTSCECKCKFDGRNCNCNQWWNNDKCRCEYVDASVKTSYMWKYSNWNPASCCCENGQYLASIIKE